MKTNKVYLSFGRHGRYGSDTPIDRLSMVEAFLSGIWLDRNFPQIEAIYHSPIERVVETVRFRALGLKNNHLIATTSLTENASTFTIRKFINNIIALADKNVFHYHFVTHFPVVEKLGLPDLGMGQMCVCEADSWEEMLCDNFQIHKLPDIEISAISNVLKQVNMSAEEFNLISKDDLYNKLKIFV